MANYDSNYAIAQEISARIGVSPIPFDSVYSIALEIYNELGGEPAEFDSVYSILLGILPLVEGGVASKVIDDSVITTVKTWSSSKINEEIQAVAGTANSDIEGKETEDIRFVSELPVDGEEGEQVVIRGENSDTLYKYINGAWVSQTPDATKLYFDVENEALYSYVTADGQFAPVSMVNTIVVGSNLNSNAALKAIKTPGVYSVVQRLTNKTKGDYIKNWTLTVEGIDYDEYDRSDSIYQRIQSNYTIQKRTWSATRASNDGWSSFSTYYAGEIKDTTTSKYYTWSSSKINSGLTELDEKIDNVKPIEEVSGLPKASENKDKLFRLDNGEKDVYAAKLLSSETTITNRLPDEQQIDKAYLYNTVNGFALYYKGIWKIICTDGEISLSCWGGDFENDTAYFTYDNAENINSSSETLSYGDTMYESVDEDVKTIIDNETLENLKSLFTINNNLIPIPATYNAPESAQIGNAYLLSGDDYFYYNGDEIMQTGKTMYIWESSNEERMYTDKKASDIYFVSESGNNYSDILIYYRENDEWIDATQLTSLYIPQLNAPDSEQVGNAYIYDEGNDWTFYYKGEITAHFTDGEMVLYRWEKDTKDYNMFTNEYNGAVNTYSDLAEFLSDDTIELYWDSENEIWKSTQYTVPEVEEMFEGSFREGEYHIKPYQRTETTEVWDWEKVATEQYVDDAIAEIPQLEAGQNVDIANNKINAKGYFYDDEKKEELKAIDDILHEAGLPAGQSLGLKVSGAAGATTYTYTDNMGGAFAQMVQMSMLPGVGATYQTANGKSGVIVAIDATTITFESTLDADNALANEAVDYVVTVTQLFSFAEGMYKYTEGDISAYNFTISGAASATTYTYTDSTGGLVITMCKSGAILKLQNGRSAKCVSVEKIDSSTGNITFDVTFDGENALNNELVVSIYKKNIASGPYSHAEGGGLLGGMLLDTTASGYASHSEGAGTTASGLGSHAEGESSLASGEASHAEGLNTTASGGGSHVEGFSTTAQNQGEHAEGNANLSHKVSDTYGNSGNTTHSVGIGYAVNKKNAFEIMQNGDMYVYGVGGYQGTDTKVQDATIKTLQEYIASLEARIAALEGN